MVDYRDVEWKPRRNRKGYFLSGLIGVLVGAFLMGFFFPYVSGQSGSPFGWQQNGDGQASQGPLKTVNVNVNDAVTKVVSNMSDTVVGVINIQKSSFWEEGGEAGSGSGVIYKKKGDTFYIVTNHHVIKGANQLEVSLHDGTRIGANLVGSDQLMDLAVLTVKSDKIKKTAAFGNSDHVKPGEPVIAIGNPLGLEFAGSVTQGVISGTERAIPVDSNGDGQTDWNAEVLQTDAAINPGNSGGALINMDGKVIGINSMKIAESEVEGIGLSIPANLVIPVIEDLERYGEVKRPYLGVGMKSLADIASYHWQETLKLPSKVTSGVVVMSVEPLSPAGKAGVKELDVVTSFDGKSVQNIVDLRKYLYQRKVGDKIKVQFYRSGKKKSAEIKLSQTDRYGG
ncbi:S1C family serine protease [Bacillus safensis]|uniref:S1C family serine protease n=1 Tax=Bacillus safensis TaxID=561879 RepID=UPI003AA8550F